MTDRPVPFHSNEKFWEQPYASRDLSPDFKVKPSQVKENQTFAEYTRSQLPYGKQNRPFQELHVNKMTTREAERRVLVREIKEEEEHSGARLVRLEKENELLKRQLKILMKVNKGLTSAMSNMKL